MINARAVSLSRSQAGEGVYASSVDSGIRTFNRGDSCRVTNGRRGLPGVFQTCVTYRDHLLPLHSDTRPSRVGRGF